MSMNIYRSTQFPSATAARLFTKWIARTALLATLTSKWSTL